MREAPNHFQVAPAFLRTLPYRTSALCSLVSINTAALCIGFQMTGHAGTPQSLGRGRGWGMGDLLGGVHPSYCYFCVTCPLPFAPLDYIPSHPQASTVKKDPAPSEHHGMECLPPPKLGGRCGAETWRIGSNKADHCKSKAAKRKGYKFCYAAPNTATIGHPSMSEILLVGL